MGIFLWRFSLYGCYFFSLFFAFCSGQTSYFLMWISAFGFLYLTLFLDIDLQISSDHYLFSDFKSLFLFWILVITFLLIFYKYHFSFYILLCTSLNAEDFIDTFQFSFGWCCVSGHFFIYVGRVCVCVYMCVYIYVCVYVCMYVLCKCVCWLCCVFYVCMYVYMCRQW